MWVLSQNGYLLVDVEVFYIKEDCNCGVCRKCMYLVDGYCSQMKSVINDGKCECGGKLYKSVYKIEGYEANKNYWNLAWFKTVDDAKVILKELCKLKNEQYKGVYEIPQS